MQKISAVRYFSTTVLGRQSSEKLVFSLPCLSKTESSYLASQLEVIQEDVKNYTDPNFCVLRRFDAIAEAYGISAHEERYYKLLMQSCERALEKRVHVNRNFPLFKSEIISALEIGAIGGDVRDILDKSQHKHHKNRLNSATIKGFVIQEGEKFRDKYRRRLLEILDTLELDFQHLLPPDSDFNADGSFNPTFYQKLLSEQLEIRTDPKVVSKYFNASYKPPFTMSYNPISIARCYYIFKEILDVNLDIGLNFVSMMGRVSALDLVLFLNVCYQLTDDRLDMEQRKGKVISFFSESTGKIVDNFAIWHLSLPQAFEILQRIGFSQDKMRKIWFTKNNPHLLSDLCNQMMDPTSEDKEALIYFLQKKMELLNKEGAKLGVGDPLDKYNFLFHWRTVVESLKTAGIGDQLYSVSFGKANISVFNFPSKTILASSSRALLLQYLGYKEAGERDKIKDFDKTFVRIPYAKEVPLTTIVESLSYIESLGFTFSQIEKGFPVLFYEKQYLEHKILEANQEMGTSWMEKENALCIVHYLIEVQSNFSFTLIYKGILNNFQKGLSLEAFEELSDPSAIESAKHIRLPRN